MDNWIENGNHSKSLNVVKDGRHEELAYINYIIENRVKELAQNVDMQGMTEFIIQLTDFGISS